MLGESCRKVNKSARRQSWRCRETMVSLAAQRQMLDSGRAFGRVPHSKRGVLEVGARPKTYSIDGG